MKPVRGAVTGRRRDHDPLLTVGCILAMAIPLILLWRLGVPLPLLVSGLLLSCLAACLLFAFIGMRSHQRAQEGLARLREGLRERREWLLAEGSR